MKTEQEVKHTPIPDFSVSAKAYATHHSNAPDKCTPDWIIIDFTAGANQCWNDYVLPLKSQLQQLKDQHREESVTLINNVREQYQKDILLLQEENKRLNNDLLDALDLKEGKGPTALSNVVADRDRLQEELSEYKLVYEKARQRFVNLLNKYWESGRQNKQLQEEMKEDEHAMKILVAQVQQLQEENERLKKFIHDSNNEFQVQQDQQLSIVLKEANIKISSLQEEKAKSDSEVKTLREALKMLYFESRTVTSRGVGASLSFESYEKLTDILNKIEPIVYETNTSALQSKGE